MGLDVGSPPNHGAARFLAAPLLVLSLVSTCIFLAIAADEMISVLINFNHVLQGKENFPVILVPFEGNAATPFLVFMAMISGCAAIASYLVGFYHLISWTTASASVAQAAAWLSFGLLWLPFVMKWLEVHLGGHISEKSQVTGAFVVITNFLHLGYISALHAG